VLISGTIDRVEERNGKLRITDYKTGKVEKTNVMLKDWDGLTLDVKNDKIIQLLCYAFMYEPLAKGLEMEAGIISFKNMKAGFMGFSFKDAWDKSAPAQDIIAIDLLESFKTQLATLVAQVLDAHVSFKEETV
jgi:hypothetical protein